MFIWAYYTTWLTLLCFLFVSANARLGPNKTSTITIHDEDSPHGVLSFATRSLTVQENATVVNIIVSRTGGTFGDVGVLVRTIGGGESWTSGAREDIRDLLRSRVPSSIADSGDDYYTLNSRLTFNVSFAEEVSECFFLPIFPESQ